MSQIYVTPKPGIKVPDPKARKGARSAEAMIPAEGKCVEQSPYWHRREREGDVTIGEPAKASTSAKSAKVGE